MHWQELPVHVGDMQERDVAEGRRVVELSGRLRVALPRTQAGARRGGERKQAEEAAAAQLLVDGRSGIEQQRDKILDLRRRQRARGAEARHLRAEVVRL